MELHIILFLCVVNALHSIWLATYIRKTIWWITECIKSLDEITDSLERNDSIAVDILNKIVNELHERKDDGK